MRIGLGKLVQKVTDHEVVIVDENSSEEVILSEDELRRLATAHAYFFPGVPHIAAEDQKAAEEADWGFQP